MNIKHLNNILKGLLEQDKWGSLGINKKKSLYNIVGLILCKAQTLCEEWGLKQYCKSGGRFKPGVKMCEKKFISKII